MLIYTRETVAALHADLTRRPTYTVRESPAPDEVTGEDIIHVHDMQDEVVLGRVELRVRWVTAPRSPHGYMQVKLVDPYRAFKSVIWRRSPVPISTITLLVDEWLITMRATQEHRHALASAEHAIGARLAVVAKRLGKQSLIITRRSPLDMDCELVLRPKTLADADRLIAEVLTADERLRIRLAIWVRVAHITPDRAESLVSAADPFIKPAPTPPAAHATTDPAARRHRSYPRSRARRPDGP